MIVGISRTGLPFKWFCLIRNKKGFSLFKSSLLSFIQRVSKKQTSIPALSRDSTFSIKGGLFCYLRHRSRLYFFSSSVSDAVGFRQRQLSTNWGPWAWIASQQGAPLQWEGACSEALLAGQQQLKEHKEHQDVRRGLAPVRASAWGLIHAGAASFSHLGVSVSLWGLYFFYSAVCIRPWCCCCKEGKPVIFSVFIVLHFGLETGKKMMVGGALGSYIDQPGLERLRKYKYVSVGSTPMDRLLNPFWNFVVSWIPVVSSLSFTPLCPCLC